MASTIKVTNIDTPDGSGNITVDRPLSGSGASLTALNATQLTSGTIPIARIADNAVTLAKMAGGTDGQIITYDASGNPVAVGPGTDGQVLTSTGAGSPPAFEDVPAGGVDGITSSADATAITIDSSENVAIGDTTGLATATHHTLQIGGDDTFQRLSLNNTGTGGNHWSIHSVNGAGGSVAGCLGVYLSPSWRMSINASGHVSMPQQPAFLAYLTADHNNVTGNGAYWHTNSSGTSWAEAYDIGSGFSNGLYTAPTTGKYQFTFQCYIQGISSSKNQANAYFYTSNRNYSIHHWNPGSDGWVGPDSGWVLMRSCTVDMDAGDTWRCSVHVYGTNSTNDIDIQGNNSTHSTSTYMAGVKIT